MTEVLGNELLKAELKKAAESGRIRHAYLISGEKGLGKTQLVRDFVMDIFCRQKIGSSHCGKCPSCKKIAENNHSDVIYVTHEKESVSVSDIREQVSDTVAVKPYEGGYKVYIINDADKMTPEAQNALLKTLEEPPEYAVIILVCRDKGKLLETLLSRTAVYELKPAANEEVISFLIEQLGAEKEEAEIFAAFSGGNIGRAKALMSDNSFSELYKRTVNVIRTAKKSDVSDIHEAVRGLSKDTEELQESLSIMEMWYRDLCIYKVTKDVNGLILKGERRSIMEMAKETSLDGIRKIIDDIEKCRTRLGSSVNTELALELLLLSMKEN